MGIPLQTIPYYDLGGGLNVKSSPTKVAEDESSLHLNVDYSPDGAAVTRNGSRIVNRYAPFGISIPNQMLGAPTTLLMFDYRKSDGTAIPVSAVGLDIKQGLTTPTNAVLPITITSQNIPDFEFQVTDDDEWLFWGNGVDSNLKFNGSTWSLWSIVQPTSTMTAAQGAVGLLGAGAYSYYVSFARVVSGVIAQESDLNATAATVTIAANHQINLANIPVSSDPQVNARVIYRLSPTSSGVYYRLTTILDNTTTVYVDNNPIDGTIEAEFDNQTAPKSAVFEEYMGRMYMVDAANLTDVYFSKINRPWNVPNGTRTANANFQIFDGPVRCIRRLYGALIFGTDRSLWVLNGDILTNEPRRISSITGILNNRCMVGETTGYFFGTNRKFYNLSPTDFSQSEIRTDAPGSIKIDPILSQISPNASDTVCMEYYTAPNVAKVVISVPIGVNSENNHLLIYNETQSQLKQKPVWQVWDNINANALRQFIISNVINLYSGDYNGFFWKLDDPTIFGDGYADNGTISLATANLLTDLGKNWPFNGLVGMRVRIISGIGQDQVRTIVSNTANTLTLDQNWVQNSGSPAEYTIGGYDVYHFTNWKYVIENYDFLKQLWFVWVNANASGNYTIQLILQIDFDQSEANQQTLFINLAAINSIWGFFLWGVGYWGAQAVFQDRFRAFLRFRAIRVGFKNRKAGQPFQINGLSLSVQNKGLFFGAAP